MTTQRTVQVSYIDDRNDAVLAVVPWSRSYLPDNFISHRWKIRDQDWLSVAAEPSLKADLAKTDFDLTLRVVPIDELNRIP